MAIIFAVITLIGWGVGDIFGAVASRRVGNVSAFFWSHLGALALTTLYIPFAGPMSDWGMFFLAFVLGSANAFATLKYFRALEIGISSLVGAIAGSFSIVTVILSVVIFGERINAFGIAGVLLCVIGVILSSIEIKKLVRMKFDHLIKDPAVMLSFIPLFLWGTYFAFIRIPAEKIGWFWSFYPLNFSVFALLALGAYKWREVKKITDIKTILMVFLFIIFIDGAMFTYNLGILNGFSSVVAPIAGSYPVLFVILAGMVFKEKLSIQQMAGIITSLSGIIVISVLS